MAERHTTQGLARGQQERPYDPDEDWGSHASTNARQAARGPYPSEGLTVMTACPIACRLCTPDRVCSFHTPDQEVDHAQVQMPD